MTKQEDILDSVEQMIIDCEYQPPHITAYSIVNTLHSKGVVIQRELEAHEDNYGSYPFEYEPLIEEGE